MRRRRTRGRTRSRLPVLLLVSLGLLIVAAAGMLLRSGEDAPPLATDLNAPGRLEATRPLVDLGRVPFDRLAEARFDLVNTGGTPVRLVERPRVKMLEGC